MSTAALATGEQVYATLLLSDSYLPGALVLAHSLRDSGTTKRLAVLVTLDSVSADAITQLQTVYDIILPVPRIRNEQPANLQLMNRSDLHSAFTKINLWKQTQFSRIVYIDADVVAYRAPDELFELPHAFSAAPDIGWPDLVNTGVMVLTPNMGDFYAMLAMAQRGISFDGADQGLINMHFQHSVNRLSFTYNVTPSAHYQYIPAYRHFQSSISMVHFIGAKKPWFSGRNASHGNDPFVEMVGRWWAVYDRHYRAQETIAQPWSAQSTHQQSVHGAVDASPSQAASPQGAESSHSSQPYVEPGASHYSSRQASNSGYVASASSSSQSMPPAHSGGGVAPVAWIDRRDTGHDHSMVDSCIQSRKQSSPPLTSWDAQRHPPPLDSKPEAIDFPSTHYEMSRDTKPFVPPVRYPSPPKDMWYEVPKEQPAPATKKPTQIFPWEAHQPTPTRSFTTPTVYEMEGSDGLQEGSRPEDFGNEGAEQNTTEFISGDGLSNQVPAANIGSISATPQNPWSSYSRVNAWDDVPEIGRYVEGLQRHRRTRSQIKTGLAAASSSSAISEGALQMPRAFRVTDFPTEVERPSLPVTPAPVRRPSFWGDENEPLDSTKEGHTNSLPTAEGVPSQTEWDPVVQLQVLAQQQSEALLRKLSGDDGISGRRLSHEMPSRSLPFGSEPVESPTYVSQYAPANVLSPQPVPGKSATAGVVEDLTGRTDISPDMAVGDDMAASTTEATQ